jgi:uncharacterized membrane protein YqjE
VEPSPGALRRLTGHLARLLSLRLALAAEELGGTVEQWLRWLTLAALIVALAALALLFVGAALAAALWPLLGWPVLLLVALLYALLAIGVALLLTDRLRTAAPLLEITRRELARDLAALQAGPANEERPHGR